MKSSITKIATLLMPLLLVTTAAHGRDGTEGHGGNGVLCTDPKTGVTTAELLDFWVGRNHGIEIPTSNDEDILTISKKAIAKLYPAKSNRKDYLGDIVHMLKKAKFIDTDDFPVTHDYGLVALPSYCKIVGIVNYSEAWFRSPRILVNAKVYPMLTNTSKAALWFHEEFFGFFREFGTHDQDSVYTQRLTAITFSSESYDTPKWPRSTVH